MDLTLRFVACLCSRPDTRLSWLFSPLRIACILIWRHYKVHFVLLLMGLLLLLFLALLVFSMPGSLSHRIVNLGG
ncbi:hypothetical protein Z043_114230 [Scleropages formosus]|uniref:Ferlin C-terminal domain-containing protein n=1 Tax=Scleropages formosus TaxID=113540 RepID=A0A0P7V3N0_SCLFO|nr:hypothetical protein Z043_114230 [Scleropages formosus]